MWIIPELYDRLQTRLFLRTKMLIQSIGANPNRTAPKIVVFVSGVHRSGTNMMMRVLERSIDTDVFHESDSRAFHHYMMRGDHDIRQLITISPSRRPVFKALHEAHKLRSLMESFSPSRSIWIYRHFDDVVNSITSRWPGLRNMMDEIVTRDDTGVWRGLGMTWQTRRLLASLYHENMNDASINALFWYQRNQLLFDQKLQSSQDCMLINYERLACEPADTTRSICRFLDIAYSSYMHGLVHARSIGKRSTPLIEPTVREFCEDLYERLLEASESREYLPQP